MSDLTEKSIGATLRERRLELGISFEEVVAKTRVRQSYLEALEQERFEEFPGDAYLRGYLKGYAECLGLEAQPLLQALAGLHPSPQTDPHLDSSPLLQTGGRSVRSPLRLGGVVLLLGVVALLVLGWLLLSQTAVLQPQPEVPVQPALGGEGGSQAVPLLDAQERPTKSRESTSVDHSLSPAEPVPATAIIEAAAGESSTARPSESPPAGSAPSTEDAAVFRNDEGVLRLQASGPGQLELTIDGRPPQRYSLQANTILSWKVARTVRIYLENPESARLWLGGREVDLAGRNQLVLQSAEEPAR